MAKILIIDDQASVRAFMAEELTEDGHETLTAGCQASTRQCLARFKPDIVLLDIYLDGPTGWQVLKEIKQQNPTVPVLIVTAYDSFTMDPRLAQANGYIVKSSDLSGLKKKITEVLANPAARMGVGGCERHFFS